MNDGEKHQPVRQHPHRRHHRHCAHEPPWRAQGRHRRHRHHPLGGSLSACGGSSSSKDSAPRPQLRCRRQEQERHRHRAGRLHEVSILHALGDPLTSTDAAWADNGSETADSYNNRIGDGHDGMHYFGLSDAGAFRPTARPRPDLRERIRRRPFALHPAGRTVVSNVRTVAAEVTRRSTPTASASPRSAAAPAAPR